MDFEHLKSIKYSEDLLNVGIIKNVGYLPLSTIGSEQNISDFIIWAKSTGKTWKRFDNGQCDTDSGALFIYDRVPLIDMINKHKEKMIEGQIPIDPDKFIEHIATVFVHDKNPGYDAVLEAFNWKN